MSFGADLDALRTSRVNQLGFTDMGSAASWIKCELGSCLRVGVVMNSVNVSALLRFE